MWRSRDSRAWGEIQQTMRLAQESFHAVEPKIDGNGSHNGKYPSHYDISDDVKEQKRYKEPQTCINDARSKPGK